MIEGINPRADEMKYNSEIGKHKTSEDKNTK